MIRYFRKPTALQLMTEELADAQRSLLQALSGQEWATSQVAYNKARVARLKADLALTEPRQNVSLKGNVTMERTYPGPQAV